MTKKYCDKCNREYHSNIHDKEITDCNGRWILTLELCGKCWKELDKEIKTIKGHANKKVIQLLEKY